MSVKLTKFFENSVQRKNEFGPLVLWSDSWNKRYNLKSEENILWYSVLYSNDVKNIFDKILNDFSENIIWTTYKFLDFLLISSNTYYL